MSPAEIRVHRLRELQGIVDKLYLEKKDPGYILSAITKRARQMASRTVAADYVEEIISRNSK